MRIVCSLAIAAMFVTSTSAWAWNDRGHKMVATIAWNSLDSDVRERATELLKKNKHYWEFLAKGTNKWERDKIVFIRAATWPDYIKELAKKPQFADPDDYLNHGNDPADSPNPSANIGYDDRSIHKYWHFKDLPFSTDGSPTSPPNSPNAETQIKVFRDTIASTNPNVGDKLKSYDLVWLLHLVGDVHQPLHGTQRFSVATPKGDGGGGGVTFCRDGIPSDCNSTLHSFWDSIIGSNASEAGAISHAENLPDAPEAEVDISDPAKWIEESFELAKQYVYTGPVGPGKGPYIATPEYIRKAREIATLRIALAGARLAELLNKHLR